MIRHGRRIQMAIKALSQRLFSLCLSSSRLRAWRFLIETHHRLSRLRCYAFARDANGCIPWTPRWASSLSLTLHFPLFFFFLFAVSFESRSLSFSLHTPYHYYFRPCCSYRDPTDLLLVSSQKSLSAGRRYDRRMTFLLKRKHFVTISSLMNIWNNERTLDIVAFSREEFNEACVARYTFNDYNI